MLINPAILYILGAAFGWAALGPLMHCLSPEIGAYPVACIRGLAIVACFLPVLGRISLQEACSRSVLMSGLFYATSALSYLYSLGLLPVALATPLHYSTPIFVFLASCVLRWRRPEMTSAIGGTAAFGALLSTSGALLLASLVASSDSTGVLWALLSALLWAGFLMLQGGLSAEQRACGACFGGLLLFLCGLPFCSPLYYSNGDLVLLSTIGAACSALPLWLLARGSAHCSALTVSLLLTSEPIIAALLAAVINQQSVSPLQALGLGLLCAGSVCGARGARATARRQLHRAA